MILSLPQLLIAASLLKSYTDYGLSEVNEKLTRVNAKQNSDYSDTLAHIRRRVSQIYAHMDELHRQSAQNMRKNFQRWLRLK